MENTNEMTIIFDSYSSNEAFARVAVAAFMTSLNPTVEEVADVKTAVSEAVTNAIIHGYESRIEKITLRCKTCGDTLYIETHPKPLSGPRPHPGQLRGPQSAAPAMRLGPGRHRPVRCVQLPLPGPAPPGPEARPLPPGPGGVGENPLPGVCRRVWPGPVDILEPQRGPSGLCQEPRQKRG